MNRLFLAAAAAMALVLANSCLTSKVWDENYPPEESAAVRFFEITVKSYNGIGVNKWGSVVIPAGEANIGGDVRIVHAGVAFIARDMEFTCYLEAEKEYTVSGAAKDGKWGVNLYQGKTPNIVLLDFIPFKNQPEIFK